MRFLNETTARAAANTYNRDPDGCIVKVLGGLLGLVLYLGLLLSGTWIWGRFGPWASTPSGRSTLLAVLLAGGLALVGWWVWPRPWPWSRQVRLSGPSPSTASRRRAAAPEALEGSKDDDRDQERAKAKALAKAGDTKRVARDVLVIRPDPGRAGLSPSTASRRRAATAAAARGQLRETRCWRCKEDLSSADDHVCERCGGIQCSCGACFCNGPAEAGGR